MRQEGDAKIKLLSKIQEIPRAWRWGIFCFCLLALTGIVFLIGHWLSGDSYVEKSENPTPIITENQVTSTPEIFYRKLDGMVVENLTSTLGQPLAVMIDNMIDARPQYGLTQAQIVIEAPAEAQITRFLAIFDSSQAVDQIGPVRSARPYFAQWAGELNALYAHSGGSPEALAGLKNQEYGVSDLNEFYNGSYFWRSKQKYAPHNLLTSSEKLKSAWENKNQKTKEFKTWQFQDELPVVGATSSLAVKIAYNQSEHLVVWKYNAETNNYERYQGGKPHKDINGEIVKAKNVVVTWNKIKILDEVGRREIITLGEDNAWFFRNGEKVEGRWRKEIGGRTEFFDNNNQIIKFNRGTTWIEVVSDQIAVE